MRFIRALHEEYGPLPRPRTRSAVTVRARMDRAEAAKHGPALRPLVLVLEDDPMMSELLARVVTQTGGEPLVASRPGEALYLLSATDDGTNRRALALVDVLVPGLEGPRFVSALRADTRFANAPILLLSGLSPSALAQATGAWHADDYIPKSRGLVQLEHSIARWMERLDEQPAFVPRASSWPPRPVGGA